MPKYMRVFDTHEAYELWSTSEQYITPSVAGCIHEVEVHYNCMEPEYVDLGLPSGNLWATCNIGADSSIDLGLFYAWGETEGFTKEQVEDGIRSFDWNSYKYGSYDYQDINYGMSKYNATDRKFILEPQDDAVTKKYGKNWHIPFTWDFYELLDYCELEYPQDEPYYYTLTSKVNGNKLVLPAGNASDITYPSCVVENAYFSYDGNSKGFDRFRALGDGEEGIGAYYTPARCVGAPVRPVGKHTRNFEYVDLDLPSGTLWATCNLGADSSIDPGVYFAWGEPVGHTPGVTDRSFDYGTYDWPYISPIYDYEYDKEVLEPVDDPAYLYLGSDWRTPTIEQYSELINCTSIEYIYDNNSNITAVRLTSNNNGNSIVFPWSGRIEETSLSDSNIWYWTSELLDGASSGFNVGAFTVDTDYYAEVQSVEVYYGMPVRAVNNKFYIPFVPPEVLQ